MKTTIVEVLNEYDGIYYCHWLDIVDNVSKYAMIPITGKELEGIKNNKIELRSLFFKDKIYVFWDNFEDILVRTDKINTKCLPYPGVHLNNNKK